MQCQTDRFEFNEMLDKYVKDGKPDMILIRDEPQVSTLMREDKKSTRKYIYVLLSDLNNSFKVNPEFKLNDDEIVDLVMSLSKEYYHYRVQDFAIFVRNAKSGRYGKAYNRLDVPMVWEWIKKYDQQRDAVCEHNNLNMRISDQYERESPKNKLNMEKIKSSFDHNTQIAREKAKTDESN